MKRKHGEAQARSYYQGRILKGLVRALVLGCNRSTICYRCQIIEETCRVFYYQSIYLPRIATRYNIPNLVRFEEDDDIEENDHTAIVPIRRAESTEEDTSSDSPVTEGSILSNPLLGLLVAAGTLMDRTPTP